MSNPKLSIVICTHRRFQLLELAIQSLCEQSADKSAFEVVVVDNDTRSNYEVAQLVNKASEKINIRYLFEDQLGLSHARNTGGKAAVSEYIGYMDDDAKATPNYIASILFVIHKKMPDIIGGPHIPFYLTTKPKWFKDIYATDPKIEFTGYLKSDQFISGMNICFKKSLLDNVGWFDPKYGMIGNKIWYAEETVVQVNAWKKNPDLLVYFDANISVEHFVPEIKMKILDRFKRKFKIGKSQAFLWSENEDQLQILKSAPRKLLKSILYLFSKGLISIFYRDKQRYPYWQNYAYEQLSKYFASIGQEWRRTKDLFSKKDTLKEP
jgi:glucosyl-dolichyl phosphate glucuronosyltransferase